MCFSSGRVSAAGSSHHLPGVRRRVLRSSGGQGLPGGQGGECQGVQKLIIHFIFKSQCQSMHWYSTNFIWRCWVILTTQGRLCSITSIPGSCHPRTIRPWGSGTGRAGIVSASSPTTTTTWCAPNSIPPRTSWSALALTRPSGNNPVSDWSAKT